MCLILVISLHLTLYEFIYSAVRLMFFKMSNYYKFTSNLTVTFSAMGIPVIVNADDDSMHALASDETKTKYSFGD